MRLVGTIVTVLLIALAAASEAAACTCAGPSKDQSAEEFVRYRAKLSDGVVAARLLRVKEQDDAGPYGIPTGIFTYRVLRSYKHLNRLQPGEKIRVRSTLQGSACGLPQETGRRDGMFLERDRGTWSSSSCSLVSRKLLRRVYEGRGGDSGSRASLATACRRAGRAAS